MQKTRVIKKGDNEVKWFLIDAKGQNLGRLAVKISKVLMGKDKVTYTNNLFSGDNVIVINAKDVAISPKKVSSKMYYRYSGYPSGLTESSFEELMSKNPGVVIKNAVKGMIPNTKMGKVIMSHLHVSNDEKHQYDAQKPVTL